MAGFDPSILNNKRSLLDYGRLQQDFMLKKQLAAQKLQEQATGQNLPAALQLANEYQNRLRAGDLEGANIIAQFAKTTDKGLQVSPDGTYAALPGYAPAVAGIEGAKAGAKEQAQADVKLIMDPQIATGTQNSKNASDLAYEPQIKEANDLASARAEQQAALNKKGVNAVNTTDLAAEAEKILPRATSGVSDQIGNWINAKRGVSSDRSQADKQLKVLSAALTSNVPRFEGPQGVMDVEIYKQAAADVGNTDVPYGDRLAALQTVKSLQSKYIPKGQPGQSNGITVTVTPDAARAELIRRGVIKQ